MTLTGVHLETGMSVALPPGIDAGGEGFALIPSFRALSVGPRRFPVVISVMQPARAGIGSQIALKMSIDASVEEPIRALLNDQIGDAMELLRLSFRESNKRVYEYAHRMGQGGNIAATGLMVVYDGHKVAVGCVGSFAAYLIRGERVLNFFHDQLPASGPAADAGVLGRFIGANAKILVDLASTEVQEGDLIVVASISPEPWVHELVDSSVASSTTAASAPSEVLDMARRLARDIISYRQSRLPPTVAELKAVLCVALRVGPQAITLF